MLAFTDSCLYDVILLFFYQTHESCFFESEPGQLVRVKTFFSCEVAKNFNTDLSDYADFISAGTDLPLCRGCAKIEKSSIWKPDARLVMSF